MSPPFLRERMPYIYAHFAMALLGLAYPAVFDFPALLYAVYAPDMEYYVQARHLLKRYGLHGVLPHLQRGALHSPMGGLLLIVLGLAIRRVVTIATGIPADPSLVMHSLVFGIGSHLLLDVLGHPENMLLYPFRKPGVNRLYIPSRTFQRAYSLALSGLMLLLWLRAR